MKTEKHSDNSTNRSMPAKDFSLVNREPCYFGVEGKQLIGWVHSSQNCKSLDKCLVLCPPLGVEYMSTYRSYRYIADYFALAGITTMRFDYHGTGDSSGFNLNENRLPDWLDSIEQSCQYLKTKSGCSQIGLFGFRMGGTFATLMAEKVDAKFLILWSIFDQGKRFIREIRAMQLTSAIQENQEENLLEAGGIVYWPETENAIREIDLLKYTPKSANTLIIPRDDLTPNSKLRDHFKNRGLDVEQVELAGSADMLRDPYFTIVPHESIYSIVKWVTSLPNEGACSSSASSISMDDSSRTGCALQVPAVTPSSTHTNDFNIKEQFFRFGSNYSRFGISSYPVDDFNPTLPRVLILNSGATHRVGPSRLHVTLARQLCGHGFLVYRIDIPGLGDSYIDDSSQEHEEYIETSSEEIYAAISEIEVVHGKGKYIVAGLCSGAYFAFQAGLDLQKSNIVESVLINPLTFYWHKGMTFENTPAKNFSAWSWYRKALTNSESWKKLFSGKINYTFLIKTIIKRIEIKLLSKSKHLMKNIRVEKPEANKNDLDLDLLKIASNNTHITFILSRSDPGLDLLMTSAGATTKKLIQQKELNIHMVENADHTFSKFSPRKTAIETIVSHLTSRYCK